jgi:hypothetical protein
MTYGELYVGMLRLALFLAILVPSAAGLLWLASWTRFLALSYLPWPPL